MKIKITLFALLLSLISFGQDREYETANSNYKNQNYSEAIAIGEKILQNQYGSVSPLLKVYTTFLIADSYRLLNKYPVAIKKYKEYLEVIISSSLFNDKMKEKAKIEIQKNIDEMQSKLQNGNTTVAKTQSTETNSDSSSNKTTTIVVTGQGKTKYEAQQNALRNAIEQAFGAFISSKTEVLNDSLVKDEIVSVSNGNIQKFEEVSETILQNNDFSLTLNATVSITKLTSFVESKGWEVEFKGALFGANLRQQKLNEEAEFKAILNLCEVSNEILSNSLDYSLEASKPTLANQSSNLYQIAITVKAATNENFKKFSDYFRSIIKSICMTTDEVANYNSLNKKVYTLILDENENLSFRNPKTCIALQNLFIKSNQYIHNFIITTDIGTIPVNLIKEKSNIRFYDGPRNNIWRLNVIDDEDFNGQGADIKRIYVGTGFPNFKVSSKNTGNEIRFLENKSWNIYHEYLYYTPNHLFFAKEIYFVATGNDYDLNANFRYSNYAGHAPGVIYTYIGKLNLSPWAYLSKYIATFSEEEVFKITGFTVKKLN